jgi:acetyl esterase/lipase
MGSSFLSSIPYLRSVRYDGGRRSPWVWDFAGQYNVLEPKHVPIPKRRGIVFNIHGGGFMCSQDEDYYPSVSFLARLGYTVIGVGRLSIEK